MAAGSGGNSGFGNIVITNGNGEGMGGGTVTPGANPASPKLSAGTAVRTGAMTAEIRFTSSAAGRYYYSAVNSGANEPAVGTNGLGAACSAGSNTVTVHVTSGVKDVYIKVKDADGNVSGALKVTVPAYAGQAQTDTPETPPNFDGVKVTGGTVVYLNPDFSTIVINFGNY
jgi:hypothetical protein